MKRFAFLLLIVAFFAACQKDTLPVTHERLNMQVGDQVEVGVVGDRLIDLPEAIRLTSNNGVCQVEVLSTQWVKVTALKVGVDTLHMEYHDCTAKMKVGAYDIPITVGPKE